MKKFIVGLFIVALFILPLQLRCLYESNLGLSEGRDSLQVNDNARAAKSFAHAIKWRSVVNPYADEAAQELTKLIESSQGEVKIDALNEFRRALFVSRSFYTQESDQQLIAHVTAQLEALGARKPSPITLANPFRVNFTSQILSQIGFWGWIVSVLALIYWGFSPDGKFVRRPGIVFSVFALLFFALWLSMLRFA